MPNSEPVSPAADFRGPAIACRGSGVGARARRARRGASRDAPLAREARAAWRDRRGPPRLHNPLAAPCPGPGRPRAPRRARRRANRTKLKGQSAIGYKKTRTEHTKPYTRILTYHMTAIGIDVDRANAIERCYWR